MKRVVHVKLNDCFWSLTPEQWHQTVKMAFTDEGFNLDAVGGHRLKKPLSMWSQYYDLGQWCDEDWEDELKELEGLTCQ